MKRLIKASLIVLAVSGLTLAKSPSRLPVDQAAAVVCGGVGAAIATAPAGLVIPPPNLPGPGGKP